MPWKGPIAHHVFEGNMRDPKTVPSVLEDFKKRFGLGQTKWSWPGCHGRSVATAVLAERFPVGYIGVMLLRKIMPAGFIEPCLPSHTSKPPAAGQWIHEIKIGRVRRVTCTARAIDSQCGILPGRSDLS